jgi:hypothetical protein
MLAQKHLYKVEISSMLQFQKAFAKALIHNTYLEVESIEMPRRSPRNVLTTEHGIFTLPAWKKFFEWSMQRAQILNADVLSAKKRPALVVSALWVFIDALDAS